MEFFGQNAPSEPDPSAGHMPAEGVPSAAQPLAERMRPRSFDDWIGHDELTGPESFLRRALEAGALPSLIFWGPPGCGKTTLAHIIARQANLSFASLSAVTSGIKDVKAVIGTAQMRLRAGGAKTLLFIDEIHRFNKAQQDAFLPHVENGTITLVGATTENPSFSVIAPLLSRCRVLSLTPLGPEHIMQILRRALASGQLALGGEHWEAPDDVLRKIGEVCDGDARRALGLLEQSVVATRAALSEASEDQTMRLDLATLGEVIRRDHMVYDKSGEEHFNLISAFHKSMRASHPDAALYWMARMLEAGEDPLYIARRVTACASEDVGLADPQAMVQAVAALQAIHFLGMPEAELALAQAVIYVATAPKSNRGCLAKDAAKALVREYGPQPVPLHLRNAPTALMKELGYHRAYQYDHDAPNAFSGQPCLPEAIGETTRLYEPTERGFEKEIAKRMAWWEKRREEWGDKEEAK